VNRKYRLTRSSDIQRVRRLGSSFASPLLVLIVEKERSESAVRVAFLASKTMGIAVARNRAKRVLRSSFEQFIDQVIPGTNLLIIARAGLLTSSFTGVQKALNQVLNKARILKENDRII
jgi:ribonuclease P protein component